MRHSKLFRWGTVWTLAIALAPSTSSAQEADTLSISGTFYIQALQGTVGADLAEVYADGDPHAWTLTLRGVTYSYDTYYTDWGEGLDTAYDTGWITCVHATSFDFEFFGPDADVLNEVVSQPLMRGSLTNGAFFEVWNGYTYASIDPSGGGPYSSWHLGLSPLVATAGVTFYCSGELKIGSFFNDEYGYATIMPQRLGASYSSITDERPGNRGSLVSYGDIVDIGSAEPPLPPPPPTLSIADGSVREGNKGTSRLSLTVTLSRSSNNTVTVNYATANGTALAKSDYTATSGTLTFQPGQTSRTIANSIIGDRKREPDETFYVKLSNAVGATINDGVATATILNDD